MIRKNNMKKRNYLYYLRVRDIERANEHRCELHLK